MTSRVVLSAAIGLAVMLAVALAYAMAARRFRILWHPLSLIVAVVIVSVAVSVAGELARAGWVGVPSMVRRSAIGGLGWGVLVSVAVWVSRRTWTWWSARGHL